MVPPLKIPRSRLAELAENFAPSLGYRLCTQRLFQTIHLIGSESKPGRASYARRRLKRHAGKIFCNKAFHISAAPGCCILRDRRSDSHRTDSLVYATIQMPRWIIPRSPNFLLLLFLRMRIFCMQASGPKVSRHTDEAVHPPVLKPDLQNYNL